MKNQNEIILFQTQRLFTLMSKRFLCLLQDLQVEHEIHFNKLKDNLPFSYESLINQADYFSPDKYSYLRKKVFDIGGDCNRELQSEIDKYEIILKRENK